MLDFNNLPKKYEIGTNESDEEYELRIDSYHDSDNLTWNEIALLLNSNTGCDYSESHYRKNYKMYLLGSMMAQMKEAKDKYEEDEIPLDQLEYSSTKDYVPDEEGPVVYKDDTSTLSSEDRDKIVNGCLRSIDRVPAARALRQDVRFNSFYRQVRNEDRRLPPPTDFVRFKPDAANVHSNMEYVVSIADLHAGARFESLNNSYSLEELRTRFEKLLAELRVFVEERKVTKLNVVSLGDLVQGMLRISDARLNEKAVVQAFVFVRRLLCSFLNNLSTFCDVDFYMVCYSNHDQLRPLGTKASELAAEDMGVIMLADLTDMLADNPHVKVIGDDTKDYLEFNISKFSFIAMHGHQINSIDGVNRSIVANHRKLYDYIILGHSHSARDVINAEEGEHDVETLVAPSIVGSDPYADKLFVGSKAASVIWGFDPCYGHTFTQKIILN